MKCYIYKSRKKEEFYLYVVRKDDFSEVPDRMYQSFKEPVFVMELDLTPERKLARVEPTVVLNYLRTKGYYFQLPPTHFAGPDQIQ